MQVRRRAGGTFRVLSVRFEGPATVRRIPVETTSIMGGRMMNISDNRVEGKIWRDTEALGAGKPCRCNFTTS